MEQPELTQEISEPTQEQQPASQRFFALEQLTDQAQTIELIADAMQVYRRQTAEQLDAGQKAQAFEIYKVLEQQRDAGRAGAAAESLLQL